MQFLLVHYAYEIGYIEETMRGNVLVSKSTCDEFSSIRAMTLYLWLGAIISSLVSSVQIFACSESSSLTILEMS